MRRGTLTSLVVRLPQDQVNAIVTALEAFDCGAEATGAKWRDDFATYRRESAWLGSPPGRPDADR